LAGYDHDDGVKSGFRSVFEPEIICQPGTAGAGGLLELIRLSATSRTLRDALLTDELWEPYLSRLEDRFPRFSLGSGLPDEFVVGGEGRNEV
jgi:hypothetical protein